MNAHYKKMLLLALLAISMPFSCNTLAAIKSTLPSNYGDPLIHTIEFYGTLFACFVFLGLYLSLIKFLKPKSLYIVLTSIFLAFFSLFCFFYPMAEQLRWSSESIVQAQQANPFFAGFIPLLGHWFINLFYIFAQMWQFFAFSILFWQLVNLLCNLKEAKKYYVLFAFLCFIIGTFLADKLILFSIRFCGGHSLTSSLKTHFGIVIVSLFATLTILFFIKHANLQVEKVENKSKNNEKTNINLHKYLSLISITIIFYSLCNYFFDKVFKANIMQAFQDPHQYQNFMSNLSTSKLGIAATLIGFICAYFAIRNLSIRKMLFIVPLSMLFFALLYILSIYTGCLNFLTAFVSSENLTIDLIIGVAFLNILGGFISIIFLASRQLLYIPLPLGFKTSGHAIVETIAPVIFKIIIMIFTTLLVGTFGGSISYINLIPLFLSIIIVLSIIWIFINLQLTAKFNKVSSI